MRIISLLLALAAGQGKPCDEKQKCAAPLECMKTRSGRATCEQRCNESDKNKQGSCPVDQRCVKDGAQFICRPVNDGTSFKEEGPGM
jgi:hypothetical protein